MQPLRFTKMQGAGNDFVVIDNRKRELTTDQIIKLTPDICNRHFGIGADGVISMQPPAKPSVHYTMFYRNADGSDAGMCGNGGRCLALLASRLGMGNELVFNVHKNTYQATVEPRRKHVRIHFPLKVQPKKIAWNKNREIYSVPAGAEHIVVPVSTDKIQDDKQLRGRGRELRYHPTFNPPGANVDFICGKSPEEILIKTYERGVEDLTLACGTGAVAGAVCWHFMQQARPNRNEITVQAAGGTLSVHFAYNRSESCYSDIALSGEAHVVFEGSYAF